MKVGPAMLRCFSTLGCADASLDEALALAAKHGLGAIELRALGGTTDLPAYFARHFGSPAALAAHAGRQPVRIVALDTSWQLTDATPGARAAFLAYLPWAEALGVPRLRAFDGGGAGDVGAACSEAAASIRWWRGVQQARGTKVDVMVETHDSLVTAAALEQFLALVPGTAVLWDAHHTWKRGAEDPVATWRAMRNAIVHVHLKDSISQPSARHAWTYVPPGEGEFPAAPLLAALRADGFGGPVSLEWEKLWHPYLPALDVALRVAAERQWW